MSVLIKGMEMPETCCQCVFMYYDPNTENSNNHNPGSYLCSLTHEEIWNQQRDPRCPLSPVPPHGRLIDADAFLEEDKRKFNEYRKDNDLDDTCHRVLQWAIEDAPTIIPAEEGKT